MSEKSSSKEPSRDLEPVWRPYTPEAAIPMNKYLRHVNQKFNLGLKDSRQLQKWSTSSPQEFWIDLWSYLEIVPELPKGLTRAYDPAIPIDEIPPFFEGVHVNYAENVLNQPHASPHSIALIGIREGQSLEGEQWTWSELRERVRETRSALIRSGIREGDRVAAIISTSIWSVTIFLAAASLGAIFTSIASDFGVEGCASRLELVEPSIIFADSHVTYKGNQRVNLDKISSILSRLSHTPLAVLIELQRTPKHSFLTLSEFLLRSSKRDELDFKRLPFSSPLYILYSSGTSGPPKCLVHHHGLILQHQKVGKLHNSLKAGDVVFQYSSPSWVLWNVMVGHLSVGTTLVLYDGSPTFPTPEKMLEIVQRHRVNYWGVSPRYLQQLEIDGVMLKDKYNLQSLRMVQTTGAHLSASQYYWFYKVFPSKIHLTNVAGGTDIATSWVASDPTGPVYPSETQMPALGHDVDVANSITGQSIRDIGGAGELICRLPFPSMPVFMWGDKDNKKYKESYFEKFDFPCWAQHDWISFNPVTGGSTIHGRSDGILNPQGIRFGSSEIYAITEASPFNKAIETTLCVGRTRKGLDTDESVFLFVIMREGHRFDATLEKNIRDAIRSGLSARHVPRFVLPVKEIPITVNGKKVETLVKQVICSGEMPKRISSTVVNSGCLESFRQYYHLELQQPGTRSKL
ncbi:unnamed protein product [Clonostachys rosea f. rosea IK726]|uniref:AMP-dependent synthetase/ligase domain-containing protein n=2 Tax=Bionectria ochroleuca TaxID=29856 RepID=A0A0B7KNG4_BIOOC|nr:unnamed protein product [Clonostachys rosea f. rosea IK726]